MRFSAVMPVRTFCREAFIANSSDQFLRMVLTYYEVLDNAVLITLGEIAFCDPFLVML